ncbi:MAG: cell division protein FtsZ [Candidatus Natronoplasma sp.]
MEKEDDVMYRKVEMKILGVGGLGIEVIDGLMEDRYDDIDGLVALDTDEKHLDEIEAQEKVLLGHGNSAEGDLMVGEKLAENYEDEVVKQVEGSDIVFLTGGMGRGTGTGALPIVAEIAEEEGACVLAMVALPYLSEGKENMEKAKAGLKELEKYCDAVNMIPNDRGPEFGSFLTVDTFFKRTDEVLVESIREVIDIIIQPGLVNIDYNDLRTIIEDGQILMIGKGESDEGVEKAVEKAFSSSLIEDLSGSKGALVRVTGGEDMTVAEAEKAANMVNEKMGEDARIIWGCNVEEELGEKVRVYQVITDVHHDVEAFFSWFVEKRIDELRKELKMWRGFLEE